MIVIAACAENPSGRDDLSLSETKRRRHRQYAIYGRGGYGAHIQHGYSQSQHGYGHIQPHYGQIQHAYSQHNGYGQPNGYVQVAGYARGYGQTNGYGYALAHTHGQLNGYTGMKNEVKQPTVESMINNEHYVAISSATIKEATIDIVTEFLRIKNSLMTLKIRL